MYRIEIAGKKYRLLFDMAAYEMIEAAEWNPPQVEGEDEPSCGFDAMLAAWDHPRTKSRTTMRLLCILANNALEAEGKEPELDEKKLLHQLRPGLMPLVNAAVVMALKQGNSRTILPEDDDDHDVVLEEIEAKKEGAEA